MSFLILIIAFWLFLGILSFLTALKNRKGWFLLPFVFLALILAFSNYMYTDMGEGAILFAKLATTAFMFLVWLMLFMAVSFRESSKRFQIVGYLLLLVFAFSAVFSTFLIYFPNLEFVSLEYSYMSGMYILFFHDILLFIYLLYTILGLLLCVFFVKGLRFPILILCLLLFLAQIFFPIFVEAGEYIAVSSFLFVPIFILLSYEILAKRFLKVSKFLLYFAEISFIFTLLLIIFSIFSALVFGDIIAWTPFLLITYFLFAVMLVFLNRIFLHALPKRGDDELLKYLEKRMALELDLERLAVLSERYVQVILRKVEVGIVIGDFRYGFTDLGYQEAFGEDIFVTRKSLFPIEELYKEGVDVVIPLNRRIVDNGVVFVKGKKLLRAREVRQLEDFVRIASVAFSRAILYAESSRVNEVLAKRVEEQTKDIRLKMEKMEAMRKREGDLLGILGHELRTPLTIAKNAVEMIKAGEDLEKYLSYIETAMHRETRLVETLLTATRLDSDGVDVRFTGVNLLEVLENTRMAFEKEAKEKGLVLRVSFEKGRVWRIKADVLHIQQVVDNLVSNAIKYTKTGRIDVSLEDYGKEIGVFVKDTGEGLSSEDLQNIGQKFYRGNHYIGNSALVRPGGTGLGLYVTFGLVKAMGGRYDIESELGKGSLFKVFFLKFL